MGQSVEETSSDGLTDTDRNQEVWLSSNVLCYSCGEPVIFGDTCVSLRLVYPAPHTGSVMLLDAIEEDGAPTAEQLVFCFDCWDSHTEELKYELETNFFSKRRGGVHPKSCTFCTAS
jgi:hypothetical protein